MENTGGARMNSAEAPCVECGQEIALSNPKMRVPERCDECKNKPTPPKVYKTPMKSRLCAKCGRPTPSGRYRLCDSCRAVPRRKPNPTGQRGNTTERGYGAEHQKLRQQWAALIRQGGISCSRCGRPIWPGTAWDLGHDDQDRRYYAGPEHAKCNRGAPSKRRRKRRW